MCIRDRCRGCSCKHSCSRSWVRRRVIPAGFGANLFGRGKYCHPCGYCYSDCRELDGSGTGSPSSTLAYSSRHGSAGIISSVAGSFLNAAHRQFGGAKWQPGFPSSGSCPSGYQYATGTGGYLSPCCRAISLDSATGFCADSGCRAGSTVNSKHYSCGSYLRAAGSHGSARGYCPTCCSRTTTASCVFSTSSSCRNPGAANESDGCPCCGSGNSCVSCGDSRTSGICRGCPDCNRTY